MDSLLKPLDVHGTVFETLWKEKGWEPSANFPGIDLDSKIDQSEIELRVFGITRTGISNVRSLHGLSRLLVAKTDVFCPLKDRVKAFQDLRLGENATSLDCPIEFRDLFFHIQVRHCYFCTCPQSALLREFRDLDLNEKVRFDNCPLHLQHSFVHLRSLECPICAEEIVEESQK